MKIRILVADDHPIFRDGLVRSLEETNEFEVVAVASTAQEAIDLARKHRPTLALLDLSMPGGGMTAIAAISSNDLANHIAMLTVSEDSADVAEALRLGAKAYVLKGVSAKELRAVLSRIVDGKSYVSPTLAAKVLSYMSSSDEGGNELPINDLTKREEDILKLVANGLSNREVAEGLGLQEKTIKHYMTTILEKLHVRNRVEAAILAHEAWRK